MLQGMNMTAADRRALAVKVGVDEQYLYQCLTGRNTGMSAAEAVRVERESGLTVRRWDLRPKDWHLIWPELVGADGAPQAPQAQAA